MSTTVDQKLAFRSATAEVFAAIERQFSIPPRIPLAHAGHESNWGVSALAIDGKNIFSVTPGDAWLAFKRGEKKQEDVARWSSLGIQTVHYPTTEFSKYAPEKIRWFEFPGDIVEKKPDGKGGSILKVNRHFRQYASWTESSWDWARKISSSPRYAQAFLAAKNGDVLAFASAIGAAGYATENPHQYADMIVANARAASALPMV